MCWVLFCYYVVVVLFCLFYFLKICFDYDFIFLLKIGQITTVVTTTIFGIYIQYVTWFKLGEVISFKGIYFNVVPARHDERSSLDT